VEPGTTRQIITIYAGVGKHVAEVLVNGKPVDVLTRGVEQGHGWARVHVEIAPSRPTVVTGQLEDPGGQLTYRQQPLVVDDELRVDVPHRVG
jgi:hypothetical protein